MYVPEELEPEPYTLKWIWAVRDAEFSQSWVKSLALLIAAFANQQNTAWPSRERLALELDMSTKSITRGVQELEQRGFLDVVVRRGRTAGEKAHNTNLYRLTLPKVTGQSNGTSMSHEVRQEVPQGTSWRSETRIDEAADKPLRVEKKERGKHNGASGEWWTIEGAGYPIFFPDQ